MARGNQVFALPWQGIACVVLCGIVAPLLAGCTLFGSASNLRGRSAVAAWPPQSVMVPACGAPIGDVIGGFDPLIPHDITSIVGFNPLLPATIPAPLTWSMDVMVGKTVTMKPAPFFHAAYGIWEPRPYNTYALRTTVALDEATSVFGPTAYLTADGGALGVREQVAIQINDAPGMLYTLQTDLLTTTATPATRVDALMWQQSGLTLRLTIVETGKYTLFPAGLNSDSDELAAWSWANGSDVALLLQVAQQVTIYKGCGAM